MTKIEIYAILADTIGENIPTLSHFLKAKVKKQVLSDIETSIIKLFEQREYYRILDDNIKVKQITEAFELLTDFRSEVKNYV